METNTLDRLLSEPLKWLINTAVFIFGTYLICSSVSICRLPVVILALYNLQLSTTGQLGYYRWKDHICAFIESHWSEFFGDDR